MRTYQGYLNAFRLVVDIRAIQHIQGIPDIRYLRFPEITDGADDSVLPDISTK